MNLTRCKTGHYYDADKYMECPHCGQREKSVDVLGSGTSGGRGPVSRSRHSLKPGRTEHPMGSDFRADENMNANQSSHTQDIWHASAQEIQPVKSMTDELVGIAPYAPVQSQVVRPFMDEVSSTPVVGWLVCVQGELFGRGLPMRDGRTRIGTALEMEIRLVNDRNIERVNHTVILFQSQNKEFLLLGRECQGVTYVNGKTFGTKNAKLQNLDVIQVGNTVFRFVPLCGNNFDWNNPLGMIKPEEAEKPNFYETSVLCAGMLPGAQPQAGMAEGWKCNVCGTQNLKEQGYCQACGSPKS